jgi:hypothetical protein
MYSFSFKIFGQYALIGFQTWTNHKICTKFWNAFSTFVKNKSIIYLLQQSIVFLQNQSCVEELNLSSLNNPTQCNTSFLPHPHPSYTTPNPQNHTPQPKAIPIVDELHK